MPPRSAHPTLKERPALRIADPRVSERVQQFPESVIREMTRIADRVGALNLAQGFPDFDPPEALLSAAKEAIGTGHNQYSVTWGTPGLRAAIARRARAYNGIDADPDREIVVTCGTTEAMMTTLLALVNPGEEVVVFEPFYENYGPDTRVTGATARMVALRPPDWSIPEEALKAAFGPKTKAVIVNTPNNPTGRVLSKDELRLLADLCVDEDVVAVTDEIYEHLVYDGRRHISLATLPGMAERTVTLNGISKTYSATGWRVGWAIAPATLSAALRRAHDFLTVCAPHAFQVAAEAALKMPEEYYVRLRAEYEAKRDLFVRGLSRCGFRARAPEGAYYVLADGAPFGYADDWELAEALLDRCGVASVPGSSFFSDPADGHAYVRFAFSKTRATLEDAVARLGRMAPATPARPKGKVPRAHRAS